MKRYALALALLCTPQLAAAQNPPPPLSALPGDAALLAQPCTGLFSLDKTYAHARKWIDSWNSNSVDTVMALYTPDFEFRARGIISNARISNPGGVLRGQANNRLRWFNPAANGVKNTSNFRLIGAYAGVRSIAVHYLNLRSELVVEVSEYAPDCKIERSMALYGMLPVGAAPSTAGTTSPAAAGAGQ